MANQIFAGFVYTGAGVAVNGATVELFDRNTTTPVRASTTTNASGYWTISHATEGRFDVRITNGTSIAFLKYDDQLQVESIETAVLRVRNPADTFDYDIVPSAITADRQLNLPLITATKTLLVSATVAEVNTGTNDDVGVTPDNLAGSVFGEVVVQMVVFDFATEVATGDGKFYLHIDNKLAGMDLVRVHGEAITAGTTGTMDVQIANVDAAVDMLSTKLTWDSTETGTDTAVTAAVINTLNDDVQLNEVLRVDVDAVQTTKAKGMIITLVFRLP